jgi:uncharacterized protein with PIN domain
MQTRILVDENLAGIVKWLRFFGFDSALAKGWDDREVVRQARAHHRLLITRDRELARSLPPEEVVWLSSDDLRLQLLQVFRRVSVLPEEFWFCRCVECNSSLTRLEPHSVPAHIYRPTDKPCWQCPSCEKIFWQGSHYDRARGFLKEIATLFYAEVQAEVEANVNSQLELSSLPLRSAQVSG